MYPNLVNILEQIQIPMSPRTYEILWIHTTAGNLNFKDAYIFKAPAGDKLKWANMIWKSSIPPSKSLFVWKLIQYKILTDEILAKRGISLFPSICVLRGCHEENIEHLFSAPLLKSCGTGFPFRPKIWLSEIFWIFGRSAIVLAQNSVKRLFCRPL